MQCILCCILLYNKYLVIIVQVYVQGYHRVVSFSVKERRGYTMIREKKGQILKNRPTTVIFMVFAVGYFLVPSALPPKPGFGV